MPSVDVVLIGRNEGARLVTALASVAGQARQIVYVDSGSTDGSLDTARAAGARVIELDMSIPFTAARARNAGFDALDAPEFVQFIDGDCALVPGFIDAARTYLETHPGLGAVTGWRSEIHRDASVYNQICDWEWRRPPGPIEACGGDVMVRGEAWRSVGGMDPSVIAAEDDEFCVRLRKAGWGLERIPQEMTRHDAAMTRISQWWSRAVRTGHGYAQVGHMHPGYFGQARRRVVLYGVVLPLLFLAGLIVSPWLSLATLLVYGLSYQRSARGLIREGLPSGQAWHHALFLTLSKFPNVIGMARYHLRRLRGADMRIIEYK